MVHEQPGLAIYRSEVNWEDVEEKKGEEGEELSICQIKRSCGTLRLPQRSGLLHGKLRQRALSPVLSIPELPCYH